MWLSRAPVFCVCCLLAFFTSLLQAAEATTQHRNAMQTMYLAYYGRPGDQAGINYWANELVSNGGTIEKIIDAFGNSPEYQSRFGGLPNNQLVNNIYVQLFNRDAEEAGLNWYLGELEAGRMTLASIALDVAAGAKAESADGQTLANRLVVANAFTGWVQVLNLGYTESEIGYARQVIDLVTDDPATKTVASNSFQPILDLFPRLPAVQVKVETNYGDIVLQMYHQNSPITTTNFLSYVDAGFYNSTIIHRVVNNFVVQGGGYDIDGYFKTTLDPIINEANNGLSNIRGTVAMARLNDPDSANSQFFFNLVDNSFLDYSANSAGYAVFALVVSGMEVVDAIGQVETTTMGNFTDVPVQKVIVNRVSRLSTE